MNLYRNLAVCTALVLGGFSVAHAEVPAAAAPSEQPAAVVSTKKPRNRLERLTEKLHLTDAQQLQVSAIIKDQQAAEAALKADTVSTADVKKAKRREIKASHDAQIRAALTADQQALFDQSTVHRFGTKKKE